MTTSQSHSQTCEVTGNASMIFHVKVIFQRGGRYEGVRPIHIYLLRLVYTLMFFVLGKDT